MTWNPSDKSSEITLSNGNFTATSSYASGLGATARSTTSKSSGKVYFEVTGSTLTNNWSAGIATSGFLLFDTLGSPSSSFGFYPVSPTQTSFINTIWLNGGSTASSNGEVFSFAFDLTAMRAWVTSPTMRGAGHNWNNSTTANPATNTGGIDISSIDAGPWFIAFNDDIGGGVAVLNINGPFSVSAPSGFSAWGGTPSVTLTGVAGTALVGLPVRPRAIAGVAATSSVGTPTRSLSHVPIGVSASAQRGVILFAPGVAISGNAAIASAGLPFASIGQTSGPWSSAFSAAFGAGMTAQALFVGASSAAQVGILRGRSFQVNGVYATALAGSPTTYNSITGPSVTLPGPVFFAMELDAYRPGSALTQTFAYGHAATPHSALSMFSQALESTTSVVASDMGYRTRQTDAGGLRVYPPILTDAFQIDRTVNLDPSSSEVSGAWGTLKLVNTDGKLDSIASDWNAEGRTVRVLWGRKLHDLSRGYMGDPPYASLKPAFIGQATHLFLSSSSLEVPLRDPGYALETSIQKKVYAGTGAYEGGGELSGVRIPMARGGTSAEPIRNVTPVLVDPTRLIYQYTDGPGTVVNLYEGAAKTITFSANTNDLYAGVTPPGQYRTDNNRGLFQLGSVPSSAYQITCDVTGQFASGTHTTVMSLARYLLTDDLAVDAASLDLGSFSSADAAYPYVAGVFVPPDLDLTGSEVINTVLASIGAKLVPTRTGQLRVMAVRAVPVGAGLSATLDATKIVDLIPRSLPAVLDPPPSKLRVGYQHNYTVQTSGINTASSTAAQRAFVAAPDRFATWFSASNATSTRRINDPPPITGVLLSRTDAEIVANELGALWGVRQRLYDITLPASISLDLEIGEFVLVRYPLGDLVNGKVCQIVGESLNSGAATSTFRVLGLPAQVGVRPAKVTGLRVVRTTTNTADIAWNSQTDAVRYQVQYRQSGVGSYQNAGAQTSATTATVSGLASGASGTSYEFLVYAVNEFGPGPSSDVVVGTTTATTGTPIASTWNPSDKSSAITLSNGNLTATASGTTRQGVRSTTSKSSGKVYFEVTGTVLTTNWTVGVATSAMPFNAEPGTTAAAMGIHVTSPDPTSVKINGVSLLTGATPDSDGAVVSVALDLTNRLGWVSTTAMRTAVIVSTGAAFADRNGISWSIVAGQVAVNGTVDAGTSNVVMLAYISGRIWQRNTANQWFYQDTPGTSWTGASTPVPLLAPPNMGFSDSRGNTWALASGQVVANGSVDTTTANVILLANVGGQVWQKNSANLWWAKTVPSDTWSPTAGTSTAPVPEKLWNNSNTASPATGTGGFSLSQLTSAAYHVVFSDAPGTVVATGNFVIQNGAIYAPDGKRFIARGINVDPVNQGVSVSTIQSLFPGINFLRWAHGSQDDPSYYESFVAAATAAKVPVVLYYHPWPLRNAHTGGELTSLAAWMASLASYPAYKNNPYVWFGSPNEPQWGDGLPLDDITAEHVAIYNAVRNTAGANNIVLLSSGGGGGDPGGVGLGALSPTSAYATMWGIVWDLHFYGWMTNFSTDQATVNAKLLGSAGTSTGILAMKAIPSADGTIPVIIAEFGVSTNASNFDANKDQDVEAVTNWALIQNGHTQGFCAWQWIGDSFNALQNNGTLTEWGQNLRTRIISAGSYEAGLPGTSTSGGNGTAAGVAVLNTGGSAFAFALPTGYTAWDANQSGGGTNPNPPSTGVPGAIPSLSVTSFSSSSVTLSWAAPTTGGAATGYTVLYKRSTATLYLTGATTTGALTATVGSLETGVAYDFRVYGTNGSGAGPQSTTVSQTTAAAGQTRLWYLQPGSDASYWNTPLKDGAQWSAEDHPMTISARRPNTVNAANFGTSIAIGTASDPVIRFTSTGTSGDQRDPGLTADLHVPLGTRSVGPHPGDNHLVVFDLTQPYRMYSWYRVLTDGSATTASTTALTTYIAEYNDCDGLMEDRSAGLFGIDAGAGVIRQWQLDPAQNPTMRIQHSLRYGADATQLLPPPAWDDVTTVMPNNYGLPAILWPLTHSDYDGPTWYSGSLPPGATLGIPRDIPMPGGLSQGGQMLWWNAQNYGWLWRDQAGGGITLSAEKELENHPIIQQMRQDLPTVVSYLRVLINQTGPSTRKGTGNPLVAGPPPLNLGSSVRAIFINPVSGAVAGQSFQVSGTLQAYSSAPVLEYLDDGAATTGGPTPPSPAAAVGYNTRTYGPNVTVGTNWFRANFYGLNAAGMNVTQNSDGSVTLAGPWSFNAQIASVNITGSGFTGIAFGGGAYFESTFSFSGSYNSTNGWPAWWGHSIEGVAPNYSSAWPEQSGYFNEIEIDITEYWGNDHWGSTIHNWWGPPNGSDVLATDRYYYLPGSDTPAQQHKYGMLWVPATDTSPGYAKYYYDRIHIPEFDLFWNKFNPALSPPPVKVSNGLTPSSAWSIIDVLHMYLILGTGVDNPMTVTSVEVWQKDSSNNISTIAPPTNPGSASSGTLIPTAGVTSTTFSFTHPPMTAGTHTITVRQVSDTSVRRDVTFVVNVGGGGGGTVESPDRTTVLAGSTAAIVDSSGNRWTITSGGQVAVNGVTDTTTAGVTLLAYVNRQIWQQAWANLWWYKAAPADTWQPTEGTPNSPLATQGTSISLLSSGPFTTSGSQIIDQNGVPQRIHAIGWAGWSVIGFNPHGLEAGTYQQNMDTMKRVGFNAFRIPVNARGVLNNDAQLTVYDGIIDYAATIGLRVIVDCHNVEGTNSNNFGTQPPNGLWYTKNEGRYNGTDNTDGGGTPGTVTHAQFVQMWQQLATRWRNKAAILGYDIINEPQETGHATPGAYWANYRNVGTIGGDRDIRAMYQEVGNAIHAIDPRVLIICEGLINYNSGAPEGDMRCVLNYPVVLNVPNKVVYSIHTYAQYYTPYSGQEWVDRQMLQWGHLIRDNIAPVWIGEMGGGMLTAREQDWGATMVPFLNGQWPNTFTFTGNQQGIGIDWWDWSAGENPDWQVVTSYVNGDLATAVRPYLEQLRPFATSSGGGGSGGGGGGGGGGSGGGTTPPTTPGNLGTWQTSTIRGMKYYWLMPDGYNAAYSYPLVLYLHYNGQSWRWYSFGTQNEFDDVLPTVDRYFNNTAFRQSYPCIVLVPLCDQSQGSGETLNWGGVTSDTQVSQTNNIDLINQFSGQYSINPNKRYVVGTSMGGIGAWSMIVKFNTLTGTHGRLLRAAMPFDGNPYEYGGSLQSVANDIRNVPVYAVHGGQDGQVSPAWDEQVYQYYGGSIPGNGSKAPNGNMWFSEPNFGHGSWNDSTYGIELPGARSRWDWLFSQ